jgi:uncharacterized repeat protein (TIGR03803 family)
MQTKKITILMSLLILQLTSFGQVPTNDECSNAVVLTVGTNSCTSSISGTTQNATQSANTPLPSCFQDGINDDVWFSFTATTSGVLNLNISNAIPISPLVAMIYTGSCGNLQNYFCSYGDPNNNQFIITQGTTFYIRIYSLSPNPIFYNNFTICAFMTNNDECSNAETLTVGAGERLGTTQSTTQSNTTPLPSCGGAGYNDDVWYKFTATTTGNIYVQTTYNSGTNSDITVQAYSGSCSALTLLNCNTSLNNADNYIVINANLGANYYIRVFSPSTDPLVYNNFYISAYTVYPPANNECSNATSLTPELNLCSGGYGTWETKAATQSSNTPLPSCNSTGIDDDVWFTIHSDSTGIMRVGFQKYSWGNSNGIVLQTYSGSCGSLTLISCNQFTNDGFFDINVIAGTDYFIRAFSPENNVANFSVFGICPYYLSPIPVNDDCANALAVPVNSGTSCTSVVNGSTYSATQSLVACAGTADDDVWYKFTATATSHKITVTPVVGSNGLNDAIFQVYSGTCTSLSSLNCVNTTFDQDPEDITLTGLTIGNVYYIRVYSEQYQMGQGNFGICITTPVASAPANDDCANAIALTANTNNTCTTITTGNTALATESLTGCAGNADDDVWYSFVTTTTSHKITVTPSATNGLSNAVFEIFDGTCTSLNSLNCVDNTGGAATEEETINGLIIGNTYYVRVYSYNNTTGQGEFNICINTPLPPIPANNESAGAVSITVSAYPSVCTAPVSGTTLGATQSQPGCNSTFADDDVWYSFVAQSNQTLITVTPATSNGINEVVMQVFNGSSACYNDPGSANFPLTTTFFTSPGITYSMRVYSAANGTGQGNFTICASAYNPPNDLCTGAINVPINANNSCTLTTTGTTVHSTFEGPSTCLATNTAGWDVWYKFTATSTEHTITVTPTATGGINNAVVSFFASNGVTCATITGTGQCYNATTGASAETFTEENLVVGGTYYFRVFSAATGVANQGAFTVCINTNPIPANDDCSGAITVPLNNDATCTNTLQGTTVGSTSSSVAMCGNGSPRDVWYKFVATATAYNIAVTPTTIGGIAVPSWELLSGTCSNLISKGCTSSPTTYEDLIIGNTYYLRVIAEGYQAQYQGAFNICVKTVSLPNDICLGAVNVPISNAITCVTNVTGTTVGASISQSTGKKDVWYKFTATAIAHTIRIAPTADVIKNVAFEVYSGSCGTLTSIAYADNNPNGNNADTAAAELQSVENLTIGNTYYVRVFSGAYIGTNPTGSFAICVSLAGNDFCANAIALTVNASNICTATISGTTVDATQSLPGCTGSADDDVWYKFVATAITHKIIVNATAPGGIQSPVVELFSGSCSSLNSVKCNAATTTSSNIFLQTNLTIGNTYYVRIYSNAVALSNEGAFTICINTPNVPNDNCIGAIALTVNTNNLCTVTTSGTSVDASQSLPGCEGDADDDVWYKFVATAIAHKIIVDGRASGGILHPIVELFSGSCVSLTSLRCNDVITDTTNTFVQGGLIIGNTYYIRVYSRESFLSYEGTFTICVSTPNVPNDNCSGAITLTVNADNLCTATATGTTLDASQSLPASCGGEADDDVWYKFVATAVSHTIIVNAIVTPGNLGVQYPVIQLYAGTCVGLTSLGCSIANISTTNTFVQGGLTIGNTYYVRVHSSQIGMQVQGLFSICVNTTPPFSCNQVQLYGLTQNGGTGAISYGTVFHYTPSISSHVVDYSFTLDISTGSIPSGSLTQRGDKLYGMTTGGGANNEGVIFEWDPIGATYNKKIDFNVSEGMNPYGSLTLNNGKFYGMTNTGGTNNVGVIFEWDPATNIYTKKIDFNGANGATPFGSLTFNNGKFYGMTNTGGSNNVGVIFEWDPASNIYIKKIDFNGSNGATPQGSLTFNAGKFYGMANAIFEWDPATNIYAKKIDFNGIDGGGPLGSLTFNSGKFYGMTSAGGAINNNGVIFEWNPSTNIYTKKIDFNGANGATPFGSLTFNAGKLYGMTVYGGVNNAGVIFEWNPLTNLYNKLVDFNVVNGSNPNRNDLVVYNCNGVVSYVFNGNGNWSNAANWQGGNKPPLILLNGSEIIIDPIINGECVLDIPPSQIQEIKQGAKITVMAGKKLRLQNGLIIQ